MRRLRSAQLSVIVVGSHLGLLVACASDEDGDNFWGTGGTPGVSAGGRNATGGRSSGQGGRTGFGQGGRMATAPTGGSLPRADDEELAQNCQNQRPSAGQSCSPAGLYCPGDEGPCVCTASGRNQSGSWVCYLAPGSPPAGAGGTVGEPAAGAPGEGGVTASPGESGAPGNGGTSGNGAAGQPAIPEGGTLGEPTAGAPAEPEGGSPEPVPQGGSAGSAEGPSPEGGATEPAPQGGAPPEDGDG